MHPPPQLTPIFHPTAISAHKAPIIATIITTQIPKMVQPKVYFLEAALVPIVNIDSRVFSL